MLIRGDTFAFRPHYLSRRAGMLTMVILPAKRGQGFILTFLKPHGSCRCINHMSPCPLDLPLPSNLYFPSAFRT